MLLNDMLYTIGWPHQFVDICHNNISKTTIFYGKVKDARTNKVVADYNFKQVADVAIYDDDVDADRRVLMITLA